MRSALCVPCESSRPMRAGEIALLQDLQGDIQRAQHRRTRIAGVIALEEPNVLRPRMCAAHLLPAARWRSASARPRAERPRRRSPSCTSSSSDKRCCRARARPARRDRARFISSRTRSSLDVDQCRVRHHFTALQHILVLPRPARLFGLDQTIKRRVQRRRNAGSLAPREQSRRRGNRPPSADDVRIS